MKKRLKSGFTTGACAAAAAKAAARLLLTKDISTSIDIPFPDGSRVSFLLSDCYTKNTRAIASVIKDAGDDPDVTNKAEIIATVRIAEKTDPSNNSNIMVVGGEGVGVVTKPGLSVAVGLHAINPVPMQMIQDSVLEVIDDLKRVQQFSDSLEVEISVPRGELLAKKTLNKRLGIVGGISILGTTGIVKPISADAWTATVSASMNVASAVGVKEIILSTGRTSEKCVQMFLDLPDESLVMMGDYLVYSLKETQKHSFINIHMATMWAKLIKGAMRVPQTHVRHGALDVDSVIAFLQKNGIEPIIVKTLKGSNTAREMLERLLHINDWSVIKLICRLAKEHYSDIAGRPVTIYLVQGTGTLLYSN